MESTIYDQLNAMDPAGSPTQFIQPAMPLDVFPDPALLPPVPYPPLIDYPMMDQDSDIDLLARVLPSMQPPPAAIHGAGASYNLNNTSSLAVALDPGSAVPANRSRANTLTSQPPLPPTLAAQSLPPFLATAPVASFVPAISPEQAAIPSLMKQEDVPKERVVGNMLKNLAQIIKSAGDACHQHQATRPITPSDEQKTRQVIAQINDFIQGMGLPTTSTNSHADISRKRHAGDMKDGEQPPVKKIPKPEPEDVNLSVATASPPFVRTPTASRSQPPSRPHTPPPPLTIKPVPPSFRAGIPPFNPLNPPIENPRLGQSYRHHHSRSMGSIPRDPHTFGPVSAPVGRMARSGYFQPEHGWATPKSAPTLTTFTYPGAIDSITPISAIPSTATEVVDEEDEEDADVDDTQSPSGSSHHSYPEGLPSGSEIPQEYRSEVDRVFLEYLNRICSNLDAADNKGDPIHQQLMPKKMQKLDESTDFRPFKFRIQAFTAAFLEELAAQGYPEEKIPMKKVRNYLWRQPLILRFNEDGKKAKSKGNHIWNVEAKKLGDGKWEFRPFHRKISGTPPPVAYCGLLWTWQPRIWDPQACWQNIPVQYSSPALPSWLQWKDDVLSGTPPPNAESCDITAHAKFTLDGQEGLLTRTFFLNIAPRVTAENPFGATFAAVQQRASITPRRTVSDSIVPARSIPRTPVLVTDEDEARVKLILEGVAQRLTQETQPLGNSSELSRQKHVVHVAVNACSDDSDHHENAPQGSHQLAVAGADVVAHAAEYIVRKAAPPGTVVLPNNSSAIQNVNTDELVETTRGAIAQAVKESRWTSEIDDLTILLIACRVLDNATRPTEQSWSPPTTHMPPPLDWYAPATYV